MIQTECQKLYTDHFPFWDKLSQSDRDLFCVSTTVTRYKKGTVIHKGNEECTGTIVVRTGCLRTYLLSESGKEITLYRLYPGDVCMLSASCVLESITFDVFIDAEEDSEAYIISGKIFADIAARNVYAQNFALDIAVNRFSDVIWVMQQILFMSFDRRLAIFLNDEMSRTESNEIHLTHDQVAKYMGSAREVVSRMLKYFVEEGIVELSRGDITIIDKKKLRDLAV